MKKLFLFICLLVSFAVSAQLATVQLNLPNTYVKVNATYNITSTTVGYMLFKAGANTPTTQDYAVKLDSISGNHTNVAIKIYGQKFDSGAYAQIGSTINWKGTTKDTLIIFSNATLNRYRNYKVEYTGTGTGVTRLTYQEFKLYNE